MKILAFANQKGGVGKTTVCLNLGSVLAEQGYKVLLLDNDSQSNVTRTFFEDEPKKTLYNVVVEGEDIREVIRKTNIDNLDVAVNSIVYADVNLVLAPEFGREFRLRQAIEKVKLDYDYILIDCNPYLDITLFNALVVADYAVIVIDSSKYSTTGLVNLMTQFDKVKGVNPKFQMLGFIMNRIDKRTGLYKQVAEALDEEYSNVFETKISQNSNFEKMQYSGETIIARKNTKSCKNSYEEFISLSNEIIEKIGGQ